MDSKTQGAIIGAEDNSGDGGTDHVVGSERGRGSFLAVTCGRVTKLFRTMKNHILPAFLSIVGVKPDNPSASQVGRLYREERVEPSV